MKYYRVIEKFNSYKIIMLREILHKNYNKHNIKNARKNALQKVKFSVT